MDCLLPIGSRSMLSGIGSDSVAYNLFLCNVSLVHALMVRHGILLSKSAVILYLREGIHLQSK